MHWRTLFGEVVGKEGRWTKHIATSILSYSILFYSILFYSILFYSKEKERERNIKTTKKHQVGCPPHMSWLGTGDQACTLAGNQTKTLGLQDDAQPTESGQLQILLCKNLFVNQSQQLLLATWWLMYHCFIFSHPQEETDNMRCGVKKPGFRSCHCQTCINNFWH